MNPAWANSTRRVNRRAREPPKVTPKTSSQPIAESCRNSNIIVIIMNLWNVACPTILHRIRAFVDIDQLRNLTGVCYEQNSNYLAGTHAAGWPIFPGDQSRWFHLFQRSGRSRSHDGQAGDGRYRCRDGAHLPESFGGSQDGRKGFR